KNFCCFFVCLFFTGLSVNADNTELQKRVLKIGENSTTVNEINELLANHEEYRNELLSTLTENLITFISEKYHDAYENHAKLAAIQVAHYVVFMDATCSTAMMNAYRTADNAANAAWNAAVDSAWIAARNADYNAAWNAAWNAARNAVWNAARDSARNAAWNATKNALKKLNLTDSEKIGQTAWQLTELYMLAFVGQPQGAFINTHFVGGYDAVFNVLENDNGFNTQFDTTEKLLDHIAGHTWNKPTELNKEPLANNPYIQSLMFVVDPGSRFTSQIVEYLASKDLLKINPRPKLLKNANKVW
ncbi:MAG: hypothetical protein KC505_02335, partial [Myxococcales bacterium]|nr:hypothetical protein [Myxococcales bacterium]